MQIPERVTFEFGRPACVAGEGGGIASHTMHGRAINGICPPDNWPANIIGEIPLRGHLVKYSSKGCAGKLSSSRMPAANPSSPIILPSQPAENETKLPRGGETELSR